MESAADQGGLRSITGKQWLILLMIQLANMLFGMTITVANLVLPQVRGTLSATQDEISWVITLNLVATAVATPMTGWLASRLGWRNMMLYTVIGFTVSSFLCGIASNLETLILARIAQGAFGAPIMPMGQAILLATFPVRVQPAAMAIWGVGSVFGPVLGPILGSIVAEAFNWRAVFFMIVPPGIGTVVCVWFALRDYTEKKAVKLDWTGFIALSVAIVCAQLIFDRGQKLDWFDSMEMVLYASCGALALWIFAVHCLTEKEPFLDPRLLCDRNFAIGTLLAFIMGMLSYVSLVLMPTLLHDLRGYPDASIGILIASRGCGNWIAFLFVAKLTRYAPRLTIALGLSLQAASAFWLATVNINITEQDVIWTNLLHGLGQSTAFTPITVMAFTTLPKHQIAEGSGVFTLMRNFGSSLFISMCVLVLIRSTTISYAELAEMITPYREALMLSAWPTTWTLDNTQGLMRLSGEMQRQAAMVGYINAFYLLAVASAVAIPLSGLMSTRRREA